MVLGLALRALGPVLRGTALVLAPVAAILAWGAVENGIARKKSPGELGAGVH